MAPSSQLPTNSKFPVSSSQSPVASAVRNQKGSFRLRNSEKIVLGAGGWGLGPLVDTPPYSSEEILGPGGALGDPQRSSESSNVFKVFSDVDFGENLRAWGCTRESPKELQELQRFQTFSPMSTSEKILRPGDAPGDPKGAPRAPTVLKVFSDVDFGENLRAWECIREPPKEL